MKRFGDAVEGGAKKAKGGIPGGPTQTAIVRYEDPKAAERAVIELSGSTMNDLPIQVELDAKSKDATRIIVTGVPSEAEWQELKDHFGKIGKVAFADVKGDSNATVTGIVRYETAELAATALHALNGTQMDGNTIEVKMHPGTDESKLQITGMPPGTEWQELKDYFGSVGKVLFAQTLNPATAGQGTVRYDDPADAQQAVEQLNGSELGGSTITVEIDPQSQDATRLTVRGIPAGIEWQELKDHFKCIGTVAFCDVKGKGKGKGNKGGFGMDSNGMVQIPAQMMQMFMMQMMGNMGNMGGKGGGKGKGKGKGW